MCACSQALPLSLSLSLTHIHTLTLTHILTHTHTHISQPKLCMQTPFILTSVWICVLYQMVSIGDMKNNMRILQTEARHIKYNEEFDLDG